MKARGFALPTAIFLLVILAALGAYALTAASLQQQNLVLDLQAARAYQTAKAGIEYGAYRTLVAPTSCATWEFSPGGDLAGFTVTVTCASVNFDESGVSSSIYSIVATACNQPNAVSPMCPATAPGEGYAERQIQAAIGG